MTTKTVLLAWEIGEGLGHLPPLKAIAQGLAHEGVRCVFALKDPVLTRVALKDLNAVIIPAPVWPKPVSSTAPSGSHADLLAANGYASAAQAVPMISAWDAVIDLVKPDLVVCEHAPSAALSAFGRIPVAFVGNGFVVPPADLPEFPPFEAGSGDTTRQRPVLVAIQEALAQLGRKAPSTITEPFRGVFRGIYSFPELDTYRRRRREAVLGPIEPVPALTPLPAKRRLFAYSASDIAMIEPLVKSLMDIGPEASVYLRGTQGARSSIMRSRGVEVFDTPPALPDVLPKSSMVFSHGGTGFTNAALAGGRPHIVYPRHFEARSTARALEELGCGICVDPFDGKVFREAFKRAHQDEAMRNAAGKAALAAHDFMNRSNAMEVTMAALRALLG